MRRPRGIHRRRATGDRAPGGAAAGQPRPARRTRRGRRGPAHVSVLPPGRDRVLQGIAWILLAVSLFAIV
ncbi:MAG: hypothetical protein ACKOUS_19450, partial [Alphaproteobacteria bacterium]